MAGGFEYRDSYSYGVAVLLVLAGWLIDVLAIRYALGIATVTLLLWPSLHRRFRMTPAGTLILVCAVGLGIGIVWQLSGWGFSEQKLARAPNISFQRYALFWVEIDPDVYQLEAVIKLFNADNSAYLIDNVSFDNISFAYFQRGSMTWQRGFIQAGKAARVASDSYIEPGRPGYYRVEIPIKLYAHLIGGDLPAVYTFGNWNLQIGGQTVALAPRQTSTYRKSLSQSEWDDIQKSTSEIDVDALDYEKMPAPMGTGLDKNYLVFNPDRTAKIDDIWFAQTPSQKGDAGVMTFIRGKGEPPLDGGWIVLGHTYHEVWSDPKKLALYNSLYPPSADGKPKPFGVFAGQEAEMIGQ